MTEAETVEAVTNKLKGLKQYFVESRANVYFSEVVWAKDIDEAEYIVVNKDRTDTLISVIDYADFEVDNIEEVE